MVYACMFSVIQSINQYLLSRIYSYLGYVGIYNA